MTREQQIELMKECMEDARGVVRDDKYIHIGEGGANLTLQITSDFFQYRSRVVKWQDTGIEPITTPTLTITDGEIQEEP
jgi:hypothetical protein